MFMLGKFANKEKRSGRITEIITTERYHVLTRVMAVE
jgi:hypothetical protein